MNWKRERDEGRGLTEYSRVIGDVFELYVLVYDAGSFVYWSVTSMVGVASGGNGEIDTVSKAMTAAKQCATATLDKARVELEATTTEVDS